MATPAAILQVMVEANTGTAMTELRRFDSALKRTDKTSVSATTRTNTLGKATGRLGSTMASAAKYAAGAAVAYLSIAQAKAAITTTQDLAKTTAGLNRNLGLTTKTASQWAAVAKSRDVDAKSLTMSFTTLSRRLVDTATALKEGGSAADTAYAPFKRLGISQKDVVSGSQDLATFLPKLADAFGDAEGGAQRQASAQQLLGRGYQSLLPLFAEGAKGLQEQQQWADKYGATLNDKTLKAQMDLVMAQRESKVAWLGLQMTFTKFLTPALEAANEQFQKIVAIMADDKLTNAEKFKQVGEIIGKWADKALDAFVAVLPQIVARAGEAAPKIAKAFVEGFLNAPIMGQLVMGGWLLRGMGGMGAIGGLGTKMGTTFGMSFGGAAGPIAAGMIISGIEGARVGAQLSDAMTTDVVDKLAEDFDITRKKAIKLAEYMQAHPGLGIPESLAAMDRARHYSQVGWEKFWDEIVGDARRGGQRTKNETQSAFSAFTSIIDKQSTTAEALFGSNMDSILHRGKASTFSLAKGVGSNMGALGNVVAAGMQLIKDNTNNSLGAFGVKAIDWVIKKAGNLMSGAQNNQRGGIIHAAMGAMVPGFGNGDKVPAMLEPGEVVINKKAVAAMGGANKANAINSMVPRFASGGVIQQALGPYAIPPIMYDPNHAGGNSHLHLDFFTQAQAIAYGKKMQGMGWSIGEYTGNVPGFGPITTTHQSPGHYDGTAFDANTAADETKTQVAAVARLLNGKGGGAIVGAVVEKLKKVMLEGPNGPLKSMGQAALDKVWKAGSAYLAKHQPKMDTTGADYISGGGGKVVPTIGHILTAAGVGRNAAAGIIGNAYGESSWNPSAMEPGTDNGGLWGFTAAPVALANVRAYAAAHKQPWDSAALQTNFLLQHLSPAHVGIDRGWLSSMDKAGVAGATSMFMHDWEKPASYASLPTRTSAAQRALKMFARGGIVQKLAKGGISGAGVHGQHWSLQGTHGTSTQSVGEPSVGVQPSAYLTKEPFKTIARLVKQATKLKTDIGHAEIMDAFSWSPSGAELSEGELAGQRGMWQSLIDNLKARASLLPTAIRKSKAVPKVQKQMQAMLATIKDPLGGEGSLLEAMMGLDALAGAGAAGVDTSELDALKLAEAMEWAKRFRVSQAQYGVFAGMKAAGGYIPAGQWGIAGDAGPEVVRGPAQVHSNSESQSMLTPVVNVNVNGGAATQWLKQFISVEVEKNTRQRRGPLPSARGV